MKALKPFFSLTLPFLVSCATTYKGKTLEAAAIGAGIGATFGSARTREYKTQNALLYSSLFALTGVVISTYKNDPDLKIQNQKEEIYKLNEKLEGYIRGTSIDGKDTKIADNKIDERLKNLIYPGQVRKSTISRWVKKGNKYVHETEEIEIISPRFKGGN